MLENLDFYADFDSTLEVHILVMATHTWNSKPSTKNFLQFWTFFIKKLGIRNEKNEMWNGDETYGMHIFLSTMMIMPNWPYLTGGGSNHKPSKSWYTMPKELCKFLLWHLFVRESMMSNHAFKIPHFLF